MAARRDRNGHGLTAIRVTGALLPPDFLQTIARLEAAKQSGADYGLSKSLVLKDEIARYWRIANDLYTAYVERRQRADLDAQVTGIDEWLVPLFRDVLGYSDISRCEVIVIDDRTYPITHLAIGTAVPLLFTTRDVIIDRADPRFGEEGRRRAPYGAVQELLNADDMRLWGFVSNGTVLRVLRDNPTLTRPAYIEADLERIFEEQIYSDFSALWLLIQASRLRPVDGESFTCILESWRAEALETGERALEHLRDGVTAALRELGNGFLRHPSNESLRADLAGGSFTSESYFQELLRLVYRLLFLFAVEERHLLHVPTATDDQRIVYREGYAVGRLRDRALRRRNYDHHSDLWRSLNVLFSALTKGATPLGLPALGGLFNEGTCVHLDQALISNQYVLQAIRALCFVRSGDALARVNYRDMGTEELGSVYESLLELHPFIDVNNVPWSFGFVGEDDSGKAKGSARKLSGSYYTPPTLVNQLISSTIDPVIARAVHDQPNDPRSALLDLKVVDPACGSGHFLLAAARRIAAEIARLEAGADTPDEPARQHALREVVQHCIYGVDRNPLAVELCKAALWIEAVEPGKPLTFLDSHIQCGDSLIGVLNPDIIDDGIPDDAYKPLAGDDSRICRSLSKRNRQSNVTLQGELFDQVAFAEAAEATAEASSMPEDTLDEVERKRDAWLTATSKMNQSIGNVRAGLFVTAFFAEKNQDTAEGVPLNEDLRRLERGMLMREAAQKLVQLVSTRHGMFHWHLAFPSAMRAGGFDAVIGNPPWDVALLKEEEFFSVRAPRIAALSGATRKKAIAALADEEPLLFQKYQESLRSMQALNAFARSSGRFPFTGRGRINSYSLFAETFFQLMSAKGHAGLVVPTGIATDDSTKAFWGHLVNSGCLRSLFDFENREGLFPAVDSRQHFCLLTLGPGEATPNFMFFATNVSHLSSAERQVALSVNDLALFNPNTKTVPLFRSRADAALTRKVYSNVPVLIDRSGSQEASPWHADFRQGLFNMTSDSGLFRTATQLERVAHRSGSNWVDATGEKWLPLYEPRMIQFYDHRAASYASRGDQRGYRVLPETAEQDHANHSFEPTPYYWVSENEIMQRIPGSWRFPWLLGFKGVTSSTNERTFIPCFLPRVGVGNNMPLIFPAASPDLVACFLANTASIVFDYIVRQKCGSNFINFFYLEQFPILPPRVYQPRDLDFIVPRVVELTYTSVAMQSLSSDLGFKGEPFRWNPDRRACLRAELDAYFALLYGLSRDDLRYLLDPADLLGSSYPSETFRLLKEREFREYGEYRTANLILTAWDELEQRGIDRVEAAR